MAVERAERLLGRAFARIRGFKRLNVAEVSLIANGQSDAKGGK